MAEMLLLYITYEGLKPMCVIANFLHTVHHMLHITYKGLKHKTRIPFSTNVSVAHYL